MIERAWSAAGGADVSVIVGTVEAEHSIRDCLKSIQTSAHGRSVELIVADASRDSTARVVRTEFPTVTLVEMPAGTLTPKLWSEGFFQSSGRAIAFTTGHCVVPVCWVHELHAALEQGAIGAGGPIGLGQGASLLDAAIYLLRYSAFLPGESSAPRPTSEIAGDNSMYDREVLTRHSDSLADGFWEVEFHQLVRGEGAPLMMVPGAAVTFGRSFSLGVISRHRFAHGRHFGRWRVEQDPSVRWRIVAVAAVVPFLLFWRIVSRVRRRRGSLVLVLQCSPVILWLAACWALGEAVGAAKTTGWADANRR